MPCRRPSCQLCLSQRCWVTPRSSRQENTSVHQHLNDSSFYIMQIIVERVLLPRNICTQHMQMCFFGVSCGHACISEFRNRIPAAARPSITPKNPPAVTLPGSWLPFVEQPQLKHMKGCTSALKRKLIMFVHGCLCY